MLRDALLFLYMFRPTFRHDFSYIAKTPIKYIYKSSEGSFQSGSAQKVRRWKIHMRWETEFVVSARDQKFPPLTLLRPQPTKKSRGRLNIPHQPSLMHCWGWLCSPLEKVEIYGGATHSV